MPLDHDDSSKPPNAAGEDHNIAVATTKDPTTEAKAPRQEDLCQEDGDTESITTSTDDEYCYDYEASDESGADWLADELPNDKASSISFNTDPIHCPICFTRADSGTALTLPACLHSFCIECFQHYIQVQVGDGKADRITCPWTEKDEVKLCGTVIEKEVLKELLDAEEQKKLERHSQSAFVMAHADYHHCPTPDCDNVVYYKEGPPIVDCFKCTRVSCLKCGASPYHSGQTCDQWRVQCQEREALRRRRPHTADRSRAGEENRYEFEGTTTSASVMGDAATALGIRTCRRCGNGVELADGCLKMKCRCGYRFCFKCGSENAQCSCTPAHHGFTDNLTGGSDFAALRDTKSYT